jgi:hypothetical protein
VVSETQKLFESLIVETVEESKEKPKAASEKDAKMDTA